MNETDLKKLVEDLIQQPHESEWVEFKQNFHSPEEIGERISALSNSACILNKEFGYLVFGIEDGTHNVVGTSFKAKSHKKGGEELEMWLVTRLKPRIDFQIYEFDYNDKHISIFIIPAAKTQPIEFIHKSYIRIGSYTKLLNEFPEKQAKIWRNTGKPYELEIAKEGLSIPDVVRYLSTETYFDLMKIPYPSDQKGVIEKLIEDNIVVKIHSKYAITNLGALLFAKELKDFETVERKSVRVIVYKGTNKVETIREQIGAKGYALGFAGMVNWINGQLPANEEIGKVLRTESRMYPEIAIRELVGNLLIHQDLNSKGFPMIEIFTDRIEFTNPGEPIVNPDRFIDAYNSRNDKLADLMRRMGFCEEKGSGMDKVFFYNELYQLPPINVIVVENKTRVTIYAYKSLNELDKKEKIRACYQHACLKYVSNDKMTNQSLRDRFKIEDQNAATASRIIKDALEEGVIKLEDPESKSRKYAKYIPYWA
ncbi:RNA-binding domain-containing protein [Myroides phaeus]|uniref:Predicted transcriptional regulator, contains HTH domain n=1 Tax=Myroides phaeus TaxID=702745 RepID=A0A1G8C4M3_9FLAO|nr:RNA-binding domain-containing protein [Myroides phaeus]MEC4115479.1 RNA-binding domain-containing protein [Myroides phaeus]SDH40362.1 Predicted transcriptional regulator, contains HTH domain [Myroides phaeus]